MKYMLGEPLPEMLRLISPGVPVSAGGLGISGHDIIQESAAPKEAAAAPESSAPHASPNPFI